jgi:hypothetical protein
MTLKPVGFITPVQACIFAMTGVDLSVLNREKLLLGLVTCQPNAKELEM